MISIWPLRPPIWSELLEHQTGARIHAHVIADANELAAEGGRDLDDAFLIGAAEDDQAVLIEEFLDRDDLTVDPEVAHVDHVVALVEEHILPAFERLDLNARFDVDPHLAAGGEHIGGAVFVDPEDHTERIGGCGQLLDFLTEQRKLLTRLLERGRELLVLSRSLRQLVLRLEEAFLEDSDPARRVLEPSPENDDLVLERPDGRLQLCGVSALFFHHVSPPISNIGSPSGELNERLHSGPPDEAVRDRQPGAVRAIPRVTYSKLFASVGRCCCCLWHSQVGPMQGSARVQWMFRWPSDPPYNAALSLTQQRKNDEGLDRPGPLHR